MKLELIPHDLCPTCGANTVAESCRHRHTNGEGFEERTFACGCVIEWVPNFSKLRTKTQCPKSSDEQEKMAKRKNLVVALHDLVEKSDVDDQFKRDVVLYFPRNFPHY